MAAPEETRPWPEPGAEETGFWPRHRGKASVQSSLGWHEARRGTGSDLEEAPSRLGKRAGSEGDATQAKGRRRRAGASISGRTGRVPGEMPRPLRRTRRVGPRRPESRSSRGAPARRRHSPGPPPIAASAAQPREDPTAEFTPRPETRPVRTRPEIPARERAAGAAHPGPPRASQELQRGARGTALRAVASRRKIFGGRELKIKFDPRTKWCSGHVA